LVFYPSNRPEADIDIDDPELDSPDVSGYHATASWVLTGGMRDYNCKSGILSKDKTAIGKNYYLGQINY
jgi:phosphate-selective porin